MDQVIIKGFGATLTFDGEQLSIEHKFGGTVTTYVSQIIGVDLKEQRGPFAGKLRIATASSSHKGLMPKEPWRFEFGAKQAEAVKQVYGALMSNNRTVGVATSV